MLSFAKCYSSVTRINFLPLADLVFGASKLLIVIIAIFSVYFNENYSLFGCSLSTPRVLCFISKNSSVMFSSLLVCYWFLWHYEKVFNIEGFYLALCMLNMQICHVLCHLCRIKFKFHIVYEIMNIGNISLKENALDKCANSFMSKNCSPPLGKKLNLSWKKICSQWLLQPMTGNLTPILVKSWHSVRHTFELYCFL